MINKIPSSLEMPLISELSCRTLWDITITNPAGSSGSEKGDTRPVVLKAHTLRQRDPARTMWAEDGRIREHSWYLQFPLPPTY